MEEQAAASAVAAPVPFPKIELRNPFVVKVGQVITGAGVGCGVGIGIGKPFNIGGQLLPLGEINRLVGKSGRHVQQLMKKVGLKGRVDAGIGCGVGVGHGFVLIGIGLKPGVPEQIVQFAQDTLRALTSRFGPQLGPLALVENKIVVPGITSSSATAAPATTALAGGVSSMLPNYSQITTGSFSSMLPNYSQITSGSFSPLQATTPPPPKFQQHGQTDEVERLKLEKEILQTLLKQQRQIDDLNSELKTLRGGPEQTSAGPRLLEPGDSNHAKLRQVLNCQESHCFECRRKARQRR